MNQKREIHLDKIRDKAISIATPMYGGQATSGYINSLTSLAFFVGKHGLKVRIDNTTNESLVSRARNVIVHSVLKSDADYVFFIDSDITFDFMDLLYAVQLAEENKDMKIITGPYTKKEINWKMIDQAKDHGQIKNLEDYAKYSGDHAFNYLDTEVFDVMKPLEVLEAGTGFMLIAREVFDNFRKTYPEQEYLDLITNELTFAYFNSIIEPDSKIFLSEDYTFCYYARKMGYKIWLLPWVNLFHTGTYTFKGTYADTAKLNAVVYGVTDPTK